MRERLSGLTVLAPLLVRTPAGPVVYDPLEPGADRLPATGSRVHWMRSEFGCFECCVATMFDIDLEEVPAPPPRELSKVEELEALEALHAWVRERGYRTRYSEISRGLMGRSWIGVSVDPRPGWDHTVVCRARTVVFDPALGLPLPPGLAVEPVGELHYAITFDRLEDS